MQNPTNYFLIKSCPLLIVTPKNRNYNYHTIEIIIDI